MSSSSAFDPYHRWLGIPAKDQPPHYYRLLAIELYESDRDVIATAADQRMAHLKTFQAGVNSALSQRLLNQVAAARVCLLNAEQKAAYDAQLRVTLGAYQSKLLSAALAQPVIPQPRVEQSNAMDSYVVNEMVSSDFRIARGNAARNRTSSGKRSGWKGPGAFNLVVLAIGIIGLAAMLWVRANKWQIQLVSADQAAVPKQRADAAQVAPAKDFGKQRRGEEDDSASSSQAEINEPPRRAPSVVTSALIVQQPPEASDVQTTIADEAMLPAVTVPDTVNPSGETHLPELPIKAEPSPPKASSKSSKSEPEKPTGDGARTRWIHSKGIFKRVGGNGWIEEFPSGEQNRFVEIARTPDYVELFVNTGNSRVKLYSDRCDVSFAPFSTSVTYYRGQWEVPDSDDPVRAELAKAKQAYQSAVEKAKQKFLVAFDNEIKKLQANTSLKAEQQLKMIQQLETERKAFDSSNIKFPESKGMMVATTAYRTALSAAKAQCEKAFDKAAKAYQKKKDLNNARLVLEDLEEFLHFPIGTWHGKYHDNLQAVWEFRPDHTYSVFTVQGTSHGTVKSMGKWFLVDRPDVFERWLVDGDRASIEQFWPKSRYPDGGPSVTGNARRR